MILLPYIIKINCQSDGGDGTGIWEPHKPLPADNKK